MNSEDMAKTPRTRKHSQVKRQVRGDLLDQRIEAVIRELAARARAAGKEYVYNASWTAREVPCTRKTLTRHDGVIERVLGDLASRRRMVTGEATVEHLRDQVAYLREELAKREKLIQSLRSAHVEIYTQFHHQSLPAALLIRPILEAECEEAGCCIFCGDTPAGPNRYKPSSNVVAMTRKHRPVDQ